MSYAAVLARPNAFEAQPELDVGGREIQLLADLLQVFIQNPETARQIGNKITDALIAELRRFLVSREAKARQAFGKARNLFAPLESQIASLLDGLEMDLLAAVPRIISLVQALLDALTLENIKAFVSDLWDIAENDLEISAATLQALFRNLFVAVIRVLREPYENGERSAEAIALLDFSYAVENLQDYVLEEMQIPSVQKQFLLNAIETNWQRYEVDNTLSAIREFFAAGEENVEPLANLAQCIIAQLQSSAGVGAENSGSGGQTKTAWYASWVAGNNVSYSENTAEAVNIFENPELRGFTYRHVSRETMEAIAFHSAWITPLLEIIPHLVSAEEGDVASNAANSMWNFAEVIVSGPGDTDFPRWSQWLGVPIITTLAGLEGNEGRWSWGNDPYVIINILGDWGEVYVYRRISWTVRESLLSILTLVNNDPQQAEQWRNNNPAGLSAEEMEQAWDNRNHNCFTGTAYFYGELMSLLLPGILSHTDKKNYGFVDGGPAKQFWELFLGGGAITWIGEYLLGGITARLLAGEWFDNGLRFAMLPFRERCVRGMFFSDIWGASELATSLFPGLFGLFGRPVDNCLNMYFLTNGNTNDGTYCLDDTGVERQYMGFPQTEHSTYKLPWTKDRMMQCVQNPMGVWSHYPLDKQTYAYDFSHKEGEPVLCSRDGIIVRADDSNEDHNPNDWNFIEILHLVEIPPGAPVPGNLIRFEQVYSPYTGVRLYNAPPATSGDPEPYEDTTTNIPYDVVFPVLPDGTRITPRESAARPAGTSWAFIDKNQDRAIAGKTFADSPGVVFAPDVEEADHGTAESYPLGTTFLPPTETKYYTDGSVAIAAKGFTPLLGTSCTYGHGLKDFIQRVFSPRLSRPEKKDPWDANDIVGEFVRQGEQIMEAGDTGISAYNHLHTQVTGWVANPGDGNYLLTIPFLYEEHGMVRAMNYYTSNNEP